MPQTVASLCARAQPETDVASRRITDAHMVQAPDEIAVIFDPSDIPTPMVPAGATEE